MRNVFIPVLCLSLAASALPLTACGADAGRTRYELRAEYFPEEHRLVAEMKANVVNRTENALEELRFALPANAYREGALYPPVSPLYAPAAYYGGMSYGGIEISSVTGGAGYSVCGEDENVLSVALGEPLYPDERAEIGVSFTVTLARINHRLGEGEHAVNLANFYPVLERYGGTGFCDCVYAPYGDPFVTECADYDVTLTVPAAYEVCGAETREEGAGKAVCSLHAENVRDVAFVLGTEFSCERTDAEGVEITYYYLRDGDPARTLAVAAESLLFYGNTFGAYAYPRYTVVETDLPYGGMEYPALSLISAGLAAREVPRAVAHETAHQWWYAMVGSDQFGEAWQDEGLAEYSAALFFGAHPAYGETYDGLVEASERSYRAYFSVQSQTGGRADTRMSKPLTEYAGEYEYRNLAYDKGVILFDTLRDLSGDKKFYGALRDYCARFCGEIATPADLTACFHRAGVRAEELVRSFTEGTCII